MTDSPLRPAPEPDAGYRPIGDYGLLADCHSSALVSREASIDWACLRRFDAPSVFGRLLDAERGGTFALDAVDLRATTRRYLGDSLVLETTLQTATGRCRVVDAFAMRRGGLAAPRYQLLRVVEGLEGTVDVDVRVEPRFDYGELRPWLRLAVPAEAPGAASSWTAVGADSALVLSSDAALDVDRDAVRLGGRVRVEAGERLRFSVTAQEPHALDVRPVTPETVDAHLDETLGWWRRWSSASTVAGEWAREVRRSAVVLKGLTCAPTGAIIAAPTTSLPEEVGGERNWDYRFSWVRDSTLAVAALSVAGHAEVARGFRDFLMRSAAGSAEDLQIMYGVYGARHLPEFTLELDGWRGSRPVRVGNGAARQSQHDVYGHILDVVHLWRSGHEEIDHDEWRFLAQLVERAAAVRGEPDHGIWEVRGAPRHFVTSKVMLWVALDRGVRIGEGRGHHDGELERWRAVRDEIRDEVLTRGVDPSGAHFVAAYGGTEVDAALLTLPMVGFVAATDPRMVATVDAIRRDLAVGADGFIRRYRTEKTDDGLAGDEATFLLCSFWLVDVLAMQARLDDAVDLFERLLAVGNDLGLFAEEYDPVSGELLGNFPQAFTHMALINSAHQIACARAQGSGREHPWGTDERLREPLR